MIDDLVAPSFRLSEFIVSETATRRGIDNHPGAVQMGRIRNILGPGMQRVRDLLRFPVVISSAYRCPALNSAIGGSLNSQHMNGLAADFTCPGFGTPRLVAEYLMLHATEIRYDQLIWERDWVHISFSQTGLGRGEVLTAHFGAGPVVYTRGLA